MLQESQEWLHQVIMAFFLAAGVVLGGSVVGGLATLLTGRSPVSTMHELARTIRLWAVMVAMGGAFPTIEAIESGLAGQPAALVRQATVMMAGFVGAQVGQWIVLNLTAR